MYRPNVLVAQVGRKTVPNTWPGDSEAPVAECVVCAWNGECVYDNAMRQWWCRSFVDGTVQSVRRVQPHWVDDVWPLHCLHQTPVQQQVALLQRCQVSHSILSFATNLLVNFEVLFLPPDTYVSPLEAKFVKLTQTPVDSLPEAPLVIAGT